MAFDGNGVFARPVSDYVFNTVISETDVNLEMAGMATGLSLCITKDGQQTLTANIPYNSKKNTGMGAGSAAGDSVNLGQVQAGAFRRAGTAGGSKNALTITPTPAITAYALGQRFTVTIGGTSSDAAATVAVSGLTTKAIEINGAALDATAILVTGKTYDFEYDGTAFQATRLSILAGDVVGPASATDGATAVFDGTTGKLLKNGVVLGTVATLNTGTGSGNVPLVGTKSSTVTLAGLVERSTSAENVTGTDDTVTPTVAGVKEMINTHALVFGAGLPTTSGQSATFGSLPADIKKITGILEGFSTDGTAVPQIRIGDSSSIPATGYVGSALKLSPGGSALIIGTKISTGFDLAGAATVAADVYSIEFTLTKIDAGGTKWVFKSSMSSDNAISRIDTCNGTLTLSGELTRLQVITTDTLDGGSMNIMYEI